MAISPDEALERYTAAARAFAAGDHSSALAEMQMLADAGSAHGQHFIGWCYEQGIQRPKDYRLAFFWWSKAAAQGLKESMHAVAVMYEKGMGTAIDTTMAYVWYVRAATEGDVASQAAIPELRKRLSPEALVTATNLLRTEA